MTFFQILNSFQANVSFFKPPKYVIKTKGFITFSEGIEVEHWVQMGKIETFITLLNPFHATWFFLYSLKISKNQWVKVKALQKHGENLPALRVKEWV